MKKITKIILFYIIIITIWIIQKSSKIDYIGKLAFTLTSDYKLMDIEQNDYNMIINYIKEHEGFVDTIYLCPAGVKTIGYGHAITENDRFIQPITQKFAEELLKHDFNKSLFYVWKLTNLKGKKLLAISHFVYCFGSVKFTKSTLYKHIIEDKPIDNQIIRWTKINGVHSNYLLEQRIFELKLFNE